MTETTSNPALLPGQAHFGTVILGGDGLLGSRDHSVRFPNQSSDIEKRYQKITQTIALTDENHWVAVATVKFFNADGTTSGGRAKAQGTWLTAGANQP
jgi:hypothetical protein